MEQLLLQILRAGRNDHAFAGADRRHEVGERLSGAGAGLHHQMAALFDGLLDCLGHL